ncbi:Cof-type HAD-IIB family hydrolase [Mannheimia massilioguelmaensis]|uniref:Cof-type HAD-IIB family hydrolase n=1 Tax=Mannheimia massilioguelmaensis TaxID=1604354 RepID=UPI0005C99D43|nr:Cof-type HAD-IIB family hydrolase [Mannheimia massilioguelmaensis]
MQQFPFRAIVSDMDGTLLNTNHIVGDFTVDTLEKVAKKGIDIVMATGRGYTDVASTLSRMKIKNAAMITSNGAQIHDLQGNRLYSNFLPEDIAFEVMQTEFDTSRICLNSYQNNNWFINKDVPMLHKYHQASGFMYEIVDFSKHHGQDTEKVFFIGKNAEDLAELEQELKMRFGQFTSIVYSTPTCLEVMNKNVSKATALSHLIEQRDYQLADCIAFGDGMNDVEMLSEVGKGCIMQNADPRLFSELPDHERIGSNSNESVASYIRAIFGIS